MVIISMLRGVNVGAHNRVRMEALRATYMSLGLTDLQTYVQSGNLLFQTREPNLTNLATRIGDALEEAHGFRPAVILRTRTELRQVIARNPFAERDGIEPNKLLVNFLLQEPTAQAGVATREISIDPEQMHLAGREMYIYFPHGMGRSKFPWPRINQALNATGTGRNWNTVTKLLEMAEAMEDEQGAFSPG